MSPKTPEKLETPLSADTLEQLKALDPTVLQALVNTLAGSVQTRFDESKKLLERTGNLVGEVALSVKKMEVDSTAKDGFEALSASLAQIQEALSKEAQAPQDPSAGAATEPASSEALMALQSQLTEVKAVVATQADILLALKKTQEDMISAVSNAMSTLYDSLEELKPPKKKKGLFGKK